VCATRSDSCYRTLAKSGIDDSAALDLDSRFNLISHGGDPDLITGVHNLKPDVCKAAVRESYLSQGREIHGEDAIVIRVLITFDDVGNREYPEFQPHSGALLKLDEPISLLLHSISNSQFIN
jgi:hypothetical protein